MTISRTPIGLQMLLLLLLRMSYDSRVGAEYHAAEKYTNKVTPRLARTGNLAFQGLHGGPLATKDLRTLRRT